MSNSKNNNPKRSDSIGWDITSIKQTEVEDCANLYDRLLTDGTHRPNQDNLQANEILAREGGQNSLNQPIDINAETRIRFTHLMLYDKDKAEFLKAMQWTKLKEHVRAYAEYADQAQTKDAVKRLESTEPLHLLKICDFNSKGLNGAEDSVEKKFDIEKFPESEHNFIGVFRSQGKTNLEIADRGGAYGLGKNILWISSGIRTIFGSSTIYPGDKNDEKTYKYYEKTHKGDVRLYGETKLETYMIDRRMYPGTGFFGYYDQRDSEGRFLSHSMWDEPLCKNLYLEREDKNAYGTSLLVVDYKEHGSKNTPDKSFKELYKKIEINFWPVICRDNKRAVFEFYQNTVSDVVPREFNVINYDNKSTLKEAGPFIKAWTTSEAEVVDKLEKKGQVARKTFNFKIPKTSPEAISQHGEQSVEAQLSIYWSDNPREIHHDYKNTIALVRGFGMVVHYYPDLKDLLEDHDKPCFFAVVKVGTACNDSQKSKNAEHFFKAAEPPLHDVWSHKDTPNFKKFYISPKQKLDAFFEKMKKTYGDMIGNSTFEESEGCQLLSDLFPFGSIPESTESRSLQIDSTKTKISNGGQRWELSGKVKINRKTEDIAEEWTARIYFFLASDDSGSNYTVPFDENGFDASSNQNVKIEYQADSMSVLVTVNNIEEFSFNAILNVSGCTSLQDLDANSEFDRGILGMNYKVLEK